jgi:hypothetical protein
MLILFIESRRFGFVEIDEIYNLNSNDLLGIDSPHHNRWQACRMQTCCTQRSNL